MSATWVVIPAFNEAIDILGAVVLPLIARDYKVVVVDDGSEPRIPHSAFPNEVCLLRHAKNLGQGAALRTAVHEALDRGARIIVTFDGDGQHSADCIPSLVTAVENGADVALGSRFLRRVDRQMVPWKRRLLLRAALLFTRCRTGLALTDTHNGLRAFSAAAARGMKLSQHRAAHASELLEDIARLGMRYREVAVTVSYTAYSQRKGQRATALFAILFDLFFRRTKP